MTLKNPLYVQTKAHKRGCIIYKYNKSGIVIMFINILYQCLYI